MPTLVGMDRPLSPAIHQDLVGLVADLTGVAPEKIDLVAREVVSDDGASVLSLFVQVDGRPLTDAEEATLQDLLLDTFRRARDLLLDAFRRARASTSDPETLINCKVPSAIN